MKYKVKSNKDGIMISAFVESHDTWIPCIDSLSHYDTGAHIILNKILSLHDERGEEDYNVICKIHKTKSGHRVVPIEIKPNTNDILNNPFEDDSDALLDKGVFETYLDINSVYDDVKLSMFMIEMSKITKNFPAESVTRILRKLKYMSIHSEMSILSIINPNFSSAYLFKHVLLDLSETIISNIEPEMLNTVSEYTTELYQRASDKERELLFHTIPLLPSDSTIETFNHIIVPLLYCYMLIGTKYGFIKKNKNSEILSNALHGVYE